MIFSSGNIEPKGGGCIRFILLVGIHWPDKPKA